MDQGRQTVQPVQGNGTFISNSSSSSTQVGDGAARVPIEGDAGDHVKIDGSNIDATVGHEVEQVGDGAAAILDEVEGVGGKPSTIPVV